jgi:sugar/nucleoside kinase (ribokinase family)
LGEQVAFLGKIGPDAYGEFCLSRMRDGGIDCSRVIVDPTIKTGITVSVSSPRDRALITYLGAIMELGAADVPDSAFDGFDHVHVSSYFLQEKLRPGVLDIFTRAHRRGLTTSLDPGFDPTEQFPQDIIDTLRETDVFFPNEVELEGITRTKDFGQALKMLHNGRTLVVGKLGRNGAMALENGEPLHMPAFTVTPVDTTGAGDSFNAGFLHAWFAKKPLAEALRYGAATGALSTRGLGGTGTQATPEEAEAFMAGRLK